MAFQKATKKKSKARIALMGPAGAGKTYTGLQILTLLAAKIAAIDSERGSASKYSHKFSFDVDDEFNDYSLRNYIEKVKAAAKLGYDGLLVDSFSHAWNGKGGALEQVDRMGGNKFTNGWKTVTPLQNELVDSLLNYPGHVVCTIRSKIEYVMEQTADGKAIPRRAGTKPVQRDDVEYEFDLILDIQQKGNITVNKSRCEGIQEGYYGTYADVPRLVETLKKWLEDGEERAKVVDTLEKSIGFTPAPVTNFPKK